jgi:4-aminobutyrate aminotransferase-like enzyme
VRRVPAPDSYRIEPAELARRFVVGVREQIDDLHRHGEGLAAFLVDSMFTSDGIYGEPTELLEPVAQAVHEAGGLFIADEVQCGFARTGQAMWGHQRHQVQPDIMTLGKPMGNGFPVAGLVVTTDAVERFGREQRYFNTFGGNTVAVAAAQATLDVIRDQDLLGNSDRVGSEIRDGLGQLSTRHECIGDIRGSGLYIGVEIVNDRRTKIPDPEAASEVVNGLRERRVLISATGLHANVLKIRPPLVFSPSDADRLLSTLGEVLADVHLRLERRID